MASERITAVYDVGDFGVLALRVLHLQKRCRVSDTAHSTVVVLGRTWS